MKTIVSWSFIKSVVSSGASLFLYIEYMHCFTVYIPWFLSCFASQLYHLWFLFTLSHVKSNIEFTKSPCQHLRKCSENSLENIHTDVRLIIKLQLKMILMYFCFMIEQSAWICYPWLPSTFFFFFFSLAFAP